MYFDQRYLQESKNILFVKNGLIIKTSSGSKNVQQIKMQTMIKQL